MTLALYDIASMIRGMVTDLILVDESFVIQGVHSGNIFTKLFSFYCISFNSCIFKDALFFNGMSLVRTLMDNEIDVTFSPPNGVADLNPIPEK